MTPAQNTTTAAPPPNPLQTRQSTRLSLIHTLAAQPLAPALALTEESLMPSPPLPTTVTLVPPLLAAMLAPTPLTTGAL